MSRLRVVVTASGRYARRMRPDLIYHKEISNRCGKLHQRRVFMHFAASSRDSVSLALAGSGGAGVMTAGNLLLEAAALAGYYGLMTRTSGPQIRGGEAAAMVRVSTFATDSQDDRFHALAAIDWQN